MLKSQYNDVASIYEENRPGYPNQLVEKIINYSSIDKNSRLLELGAGTGKATEAFAKEDFTIDCIEIEPNMARILNDKYTDNSKIRVMVTDFETWECNSKKNYDLIYSAQAFHWFNDKTKYEKCNELLSKNGRLALYWYFSIIESEKLLQELNNIFKKYCEGYSFKSIQECTLFGSNEVQKLRNSGLYKNIKTHHWSERMIQDADSFVTRFNTTSAYSSLCDSLKYNIDKELVQIIQQNGGLVVSDLLYVLILAEKA